VKAFLSHSSKDAEFVHAVADELGRQFTWLDRQQFDTGDEFLAQMEAGVADSSIFVLFASRNSLASTFVDFELTEARQQLIARSTDRILVFLIDASITHRELPIWLQRFQATVANAPRPVARAIRYALDAQARSRQKSLFVGRSRELSAIEDRLLPSDGSSPPRVMLVSGLPGVGRRTMAERVARDHWSLPRIVELRVEAADNMNDIAVKLSDRFEAYNTMEAFRAIADRIRSESGEKLNTRVTAYLRGALSSKELPVFVDAGGLLTNEAEPSELMTELLAIHRNQRDLYAGIVTSRRAREDATQSSGVASVAVHALNPGETRQLISALGARDQLAMGPDLIAALADAAAGYPPSCYHTVELVKNYGPDVALGDANRLVASRLGPLTRYLKALPLEEVDKRVLRILATNSPLPFGVLGAVLGQGPASLARCMSRLIDGCLIIPGDDSSYRLADPIVDVVIRELGEASKDEYALVADALNAFLRNDTSSVPMLDFARVLFRAHLLADDAAHREASFSLASDLLTAAERMYHRREYRRAIEYSLEVLKYRPKNYDARHTLIRAFIKTYEFSKAADEIEVLRRAGFLRESAFLDGFLKRHRGRLREAIEAYRTALQRGYSGLAIHRELAQCYLSLDQIESAKDHIDRAARLNRDNPYVIDLQVQIATKERDEKTAVQGLALLEALDEPEFYHHRRSKVLAAFGKNDEALQAARLALEEAGRPTFAMLSQIAVCEIRLGRLDEASEHILRIERDFSSHNHDVRIGLRVQLEVAARRFEDALKLWDQLSDKKLPVHLALRRGAIVGVLKGVVPDGRRVALTAELDDLEERLAGFVDSGIEVPLD
jgi:tetratricopeptide (TPR) repeat protein